MTSEEIVFAETHEGVPVMTEVIPGSASAGFMVAVKTGSRDESAEIMGISHLLEHTVFRQTTNSTSYQMAKEIEGAGGELNAFTGKEMTAFYGVTLKETALTAQRLVADIVSHPLINEADTELEKQIVLQELSMVKSEPEEYIHDLFEEDLWRGHSLGQDEGGTEESVTALTSENLRDYYAERYGRPSLAVFATGAVDPNDVVLWAQDAFDGLRARKPRPRRAPILAKSGYFYHENATEHCHVALGFPAQVVTEEDRMALSVLSALIGAGTSSRMFQQVREQKALVYEVFNEAEHFSDSSYMATFLSCTGRNVIKAMQAVCAIYDKVARDGTERGELTRTKNLVKGAVVRSMEPTEERLCRLCRDYTAHSRCRSMAQILRGIDNVTEDSIMQMAQRVIRADHLNVAVLGKCGENVQKFDVSTLKL